MLVVVAILAILLSILLPAIGRAKDQARSLGCKANLRNMQVSWHLYMNKSENVIPFTCDWQKHPHWMEALDEMYPNAPVLYKNNDSTFSTCPQVQATYKPMLYATNTWGYAVNHWWSVGGGDTNQWQRWDKIRIPSQYPFFVDPYVYPLGYGYTATYTVPYESVGGPDWGVGANHDDKKRFNSSFADGSARHTKIQEMRDNISGPSSFAWFANK